MTWRDFTRRSWRHACPWVCPRLWGTVWSLRSRRAGLLSILLRWPILLFWWSKWAACPWSRPSLPFFLVLLANRGQTERKQRSMKVKADRLAKVCCLVWRSAFKKRKKASCWHFVLGLPKFGPLAHLILNFYWSRNIRLNNEWWREMLVFAFFSVQSVQKNSTTKARASFIDSFLFAKCCVLQAWSCQVLSIKKRKKWVPSVRIELTTSRLWDWRSTDWAKKAPSKLYSSLLTLF